MPRTALVPPDVVYAVSPVDWADLFDAFGAPEGLAGKEHELIADALWGGRVSDALFAALARLVRLATDEGRRAIHEAAKDRGLDTRIWGGVPPGDLAADLLAAPARGDAREVEAVLRRAELRLARAIPARLAYVRFANDTRPLFDVPGKLPEFVQAVRAFDPSAHVRAHVDGQGTAHFAITRDAPTRCAMASVGALVAARPYTPVTVDVIRAGGGRVIVCTDDAPRTERYARALGRAFFADEARFDTAATVALHVIQEKGKRALEVPGDLRAGIARVRLIVCRLVGPRGQALLRGDDALAMTKELHLSLASGVLDRAVLRVEPRAGARFDVVLQPPYGFTVSDAAMEPLAVRLAEALGFVDRAAAPRDFWARHPHDEPAAAWDALVGAEARDALEKDGVLVPSATRALPPTGAPSAPPSLVLFDVEGEPGLKYGVPDDWTLAARTFDAEAAATLRLDLVAFGRRVARACGLAGESALVDGAPGVVEIGQLVLPSTRLSFFFLARRPGNKAARRALAATLRKRASPGHAILVVPHGRRADVGLVEIDLPALEGPYAPLVAQALDAMELWADFEAWRLAPEEARVVVEPRTARLWIDRVLVKDLADGPARMLECLARRAPDEVSWREIGAFVSRARADSGTARDAQRRLWKAIDKSFAACGKKIANGLKDDLIVQTKRGMYRLGVRSHVV